MAKFNKSEFKWLLILIGFTFYIHTLLTTGKINLFIHPRMIPYVRFSFIVLSILILIQLKRLFLVTHNKNRKISFSIFLTPLLLGILVNPQGLSGEVAAKKGVAILQNNTAQTANTSAIQNNNTSSPATLLQNTISKSTTPVPPTPAPKKTSTSVTDSKESIVTIEDTNFTQLTDDITYSNADKYKGKKITVSGFVFRDDTTTKNEFVIARLMLICCAADAEVTGLLCDWNKTSTLKNDQWVKVTGKIDTETHKYEGKDQIIPVIRVEKVESAEKPKNPYVYPD